MVTKVPEVVETKAPVKVEPTEQVQPVPVQPASLMTYEEFSEELEKLIARATAAGLRPAKVLIATYAKRGMSVLEDFLIGLDNSPQKKN